MKSCGKILVQGLLLGVLCGCSTSPEAPKAPADEAAAEQSAAPQGEPHAVLVTSRGTITLRLLPELAPETVKNFIELAALGFYNRTTFHRVMAGRMIQGGDPNSRDNNPYNDGQGGSGRRLPAEFSDRPFQRGTVAMARQEEDPDSASSQFFIVLRRLPEWDRKYIVFGEVVEGIEVAEEISRVPLSDNPRLPNYPATSVFLESTRIEYR